MNCGTSLNIDCMQPFTPLLFTCNSGGIFYWWEDLWPLTGRTAQDSSCPLKEWPLCWYPMNPCTQCTHHCGAAALLRNTHQTKPGSSTEKQLRGQIWACSISLDSAHHSNIKGKHIKFTFKLKSQQVALNFIKVPCGSEAAMNCSEPETTEVQ